MPWPVHPTGFFGAQGDNDTYKIERSLRFNSADSAYLSRTPASAGNRKTWTWSGWVKRGRTDNYDLHFFGGWDGSNNSTGIYLAGTGEIEVFSIQVTPTVYTLRRRTTALFRDLSAWYHIVLAVDTTQSTGANRAKLYVNGSEITSFSSSSDPSQNSDLFVNTTSVHNIGKYTWGNAGYFDGYLTEINFIDGQALTPSSFGETDAITGRWKAKAYSGTYGTNGFYLKFADNSGTTATTLGKDSSPNGNNWTPNNFSVTAGAGNDSLVDSPTNYGTDTGVGGEVRGNYCAINPLDFSGAGTISNGNLQYVQSTLNARGGRSTFAVNSGKWYWEVTNNGGNNCVGIIRDTGAINATYIGGNADGWGYFIDGQKYNNGSGVNYGASYTTNDVIGIALNMDAGTLVFYKNGVSQGTAFSGLSGTMSPAFSSSNTSAVSFTANFGQRTFAYAAPSGFKALCTTNLPTPTIKKPSKYMDVVAYTGTGASNSISSLGFSPDLVWIKNRGVATSHAIYDTTRGSQNQLSSDTTGAEVTSSTGLTAFGSNGFTIGTSSLVNTSGTQYISWAWDEAPIAGMDIVSYTGNGATRNISHSLGVAPKMIIVKQRSGSGGNWPVYHTGLPSAFNVAGTQVIYLNLTNANAQDFNVWNSNNPSATQFSLGTSSVSNANSETYIAYLFAEIEGFSKFGSYTGNASTDGPFVWCGFRPRWVMIKNATTGGVGYTWGIWDSSRDLSNVSKQYIAANASDADTVYSPSSIVDFNSNGFKIRCSNASENASGSSFIFAAFAESPFKYARAR